MDDIQNLASNFFDTEKSSTDLTKKNDEFDLQREQSDLKKSLKETIKAKGSPNDSMRSDSKESSLQVKK
jgi:hypothetical protein